MSSSGSRRCRRAFAYRVVCGLTGSGKSRCCAALQAEGAQVLDLEDLAKHRGSLLGDLPDAAAADAEAFESRSSHALERFDPARPVFVESESRKIGRVQVPDALLDAMRAAPCVRVDASDGVARRAAEGGVRALPRRSRRCSRNDSRRWSRCTARPRSSAGTRRRSAGDSTRSSTRCSCEHYDPTYARSIERNFPTLRAGARRRAATASTREAFRARGTRAASTALDQETAHDRLRVPHRQRLRGVPARRQSAVRVRGRDAASTTRRCRRSRCSSTCPRRRSCCRRQRATARVRIFTPTFEMPFAGHPTLGTAHVVRVAPRRRRSRHARDEGRRHPGRGRRRRVDAGGQCAEASRRRRRRRDELAAMLGIAAGDDLSSAPLWVDTGSEQLVIPLATRDAVRRAAPKPDLMLRIGSNDARAMAYVFAREQDSVLARFFFPQARRGDRGSGHRLGVRESRRLAAGDRRVASATADGRPGRSRRTALPARARGDRRSRDPRLRTRHRAWRAERLRSRRNPPTAPWQRGNGRYKKRVQRVNSECRIERSKEGTGIKPGTRKE